MSTTNRRDLLARVACASAAGILAAPVPLAAATVDPHVAWEREALALLDRINGEPEMEQDRFDDLLEEWNALGELIAETPAMTLAGVAVQLRLVKAGFEKGSAVADYAREMAAETALATIEGLAGGRV